jgi:hypothetical protein
MNFHFFPDVRPNQAALRQGEKRDDSFIGVIIGMKGAGKTTLLIDLLKSVWKKRFDMIIFISPTFSLQNVSTEIDGQGIIIIPEWRSCLIEELIEMQRDQIEMVNEAKLQDPPVHIPYREVLMVFDDIGSLGKEGKLSLQMANLAFVVRHYHVNIIELAQRTTLLSCGLSSQADFWIFFAEANPNERINIFKRIGFGETKKEFFNIFQRETAEFRSWIGIRVFLGKPFFFNKDGFIEK